MIANSGSRLGSAPTIKELLNYAVLDGRSKADGKEKSLVGGNLFEVFGWWGDKPNMMLSSTATGLPVHLCMA